MLLVAVGAAAAGIVAFLVGFLLARYRDIFFAMLSLAMSMILYGVLVKTETLGSTDGFHVESGTFLGYEPHGRALNLALFWLVLGISAISAFLITLYFRTVAGALAMPVRDNEIRLEFLGISVTRLIHLKLVISGILAGLGGALAALAVAHVDPNMAYWTTSGGFVFVTILAGVGLGRSRLRGLAGVRAGSLDRHRSPARLLAAHPRLGAAADHPVPAGRARLAVLPPAPRAGEGIMTAILSVRDLEKTFGSIVAARDITLDVPAQQTVGIIGANGAGKTTFINMITGHLRPTKGTIRLEDIDITGRPSREITRLGISRSFQVAQIFPSLTVFENMCAAAAAAGSNGAFARVLAPLKSPATIREADASIELFRIAAYRHALASTLPQGIRKLLDIAMAVVGSPRVLLLDEPTSGISVEEKFGVMDVVMSALKSRKLTVLFVEHDMEIVARFADRVLAFYDGTVIADGAPAAALADRRVQTLISGTKPAVRRAFPCLASRTSTSRSVRCRSFARPRSIWPRARCAASSVATAPARPRCCAL